MRIISRTELCRKMGSGEEFALVEALPAHEYHSAHLPGAINLPLGDTFESEAGQLLPDTHEEIVVYCSDENSSTSAMAAKRLQEMGYGRVAYYERGKLDWMRAGLAMVRTSDPEYPRVLAPDGSWTIRK